MGYFSKLKYFEKYKQDGSEWHLSHDQKELTFKYSQSHFDEYKKEFKFKIIVCFIVCLLCWACIGFELDISVLIICASMLFCLLIIITLQIYVEYKLDRKHIVIFDFDNKQILYKKKIINFGHIDKFSISKIWIYPSPSLLRTSCDYPEYAPDDDRLLGISVFVKTAVSTKIHLTYFQKTEIAEEFACYLNGLVSDSFFKNLG